MGWAEALGSEPDGVIGNVDLPGVRAVDDHVLEVELTEPSKLLLAELTEPRYAPVPAESFETEEQAAEFAELPIGNGPYRLARPWEHNVAIELERNPDFTGEPGLADGIEFRMFSDEATAYRETQAGNVDLASVPVELVASARSDFGDRFIQIESPFLFYVGFPLDTPPWDDADVRRAISLSIDRDALSERLLDGTAVPAEGFVPPQFPGAAASCEYTEFDPERARSLYESSSGVPGDAATAFYPAGAGLEQAAQVIANDLSDAIGVDLTFKSIEWAQFLEMAETGVDGPYGIGWAADRPDTGDFLASLFETGGPGETGFSDARLDELVEELRQTESFEQTEPMLAEVQEIVCDEVPIVPLVFPERAARAQSGCHERGDRPSRDRAAGASRRDRVGEATPMATYALRRIGLAVPTLIGATVLVFVAVFAMPGDPATVIGGRAGLSEEARGAIESRYRLDESLLAQYGHWVADVAQGDFGQSYVSRRPVRDIIGEALPNTLRLVAAAMLVEVVIGLGVGVAAAVTRRPLMGLLIVVTTTLAVAVPVYVMGSGLQYLVGVEWGLLPISGTEDGLRSWILPALVLALPSLAYVVRLTRHSVGETTREGYVEMAVAKGLSPTRILTHHRLRNGLVPVVTFLGADLAALLGGAFFVEAIFNINGMGLAVTRAISQRDYLVVIGCTLVFVVGFVLVHLVVDLLVSMLDPRVRDD